MRALSVHADLIVFISRYWQTTCTAVRAGEEGFVIDSPIYPDELEALSGVLERASFPVSGLLATHADWDHLLGRLAFPNASLGCGESTARRLAAEPGAAQRELKRFDEEQYVEDRGVLSLAGIQSLPVPGRLSLGRDELGREIELHPADGHTADGAAYFIPWLATLVCGDYLSPVEIPWISPGGSLDAYEATLERLRPILEHAQTVVPGHGRPLQRPEATALLDEDVAYLRALRSVGADAPLPAGRRTGAQRRIHAQNVGQLEPTA
ncbi:MAG TPA: MBL fold metallo-hydrolase [Solirubrobacteraceae bacterium]|nr:MBL fold metallo-hydrolase [Solirubrobacteraceae bacterium]